MKFVFSIFFCWLNTVAIAQAKEEFYDYFWKPCPAANARFYSITQKTDSGWLRKDYFVTGQQLQMQALYADSLCNQQHGNMIYFHSNGNVSVKGSMQNGKREGVCVSYYFNGMMSDSATYHNGVPVGSRLSWHRNGYLSDSTSYINDSTAVHIMWFDDGALYAAGYEIKGKSSGKWKYYHRNGTLSGEVVYKNGTSVTRSYFNEDGTPQPDTAKVNADAVFKKGGTKGWLNYLYKNLYWPPNLQFTTAATITVGVSFTINEDGKVEEAEVYIPFHPEFDKIALNLVRQSPAWTPAMIHNRKVKQHFRQPISFAQPE